MEYVAFEVGRGAPRQQRSAAAHLCRTWNDRLAAASVGLRLRPGFRGTGNYLLSSSESLSVSDVTWKLHEQLEAKFAVFVATDFVDWVTHLKRALTTSNAPELSSDRRPTAGAVIEVNPEGEVAPALPAPTHPRDLGAWTSSGFAVRRVRGVWKNDLLRAGGKILDSERPDGTWGALARAMRRAYGGDWTARALSTLEGLSRRVQSGAVMEPMAFRQTRIANVAHGVSALLRSASRGHRISGALDRLLKAYDQHEDPRHIVVELRRIAESLTRHICEAHGIETTKRPFVDLRTDLAARSILSTKQATYLHTLRKLGNFAAHGAPDEDVRSLDVEAALWMFLALFDEVVPGPGATNTTVTASSLEKTLADPSLVRLYRELADDDIALAEEGLAGYQHQVKATDT